MENNELIRRAEDLWDRCMRTGSVTMTSFLSPAERFHIESWAAHERATAIFFGGQTDSERTVCFFLPEYMNVSDFDAAEYLRAMELTAFFGQPAHRDYMGAILGMGIGRDWVGDIMVQEEKAYIFCLPSVLPHLLSIDKVGRYTVRTAEFAPDKVPQKQRQVDTISFTVQSPRLDAIVAGMFKLSRSTAAKHISTGLVSVNYEQCLKTDLQVRQGDTVSLRGVGKGIVGAAGGSSRKGRLFINAEIYK